MRLNLLSSLRRNTLTCKPVQRKIFLTDWEQNLTFAGIVETFEELKGKVKVSLLDVEVYEYSSSIPLYSLPKISFSKSKEKLYTEESNIPFE